MSDFAKAILGRYWYTEFKLELAVLPHLILASQKEKKKKRLIKFYIQTPLYKDRYDDKPLFVTWLRNYKTLFLMLGFSLWAVIWQFSLIYCVKQQLVPWIISLSLLWVLYSFSNWFEFFFFLLFSKLLKEVELLMGSSSTEAFPAMQVMPQLNT